MYTFALMAFFPTFFDSLSLAGNLRMNGKNESSRVEDRRRENEDEEKSVRVLSKKSDTSLTRIILLTLYFSR